MHVGRERGGRKKNRLVVITWSLMYNIDFFKMSLNSMMWLFVVLMITNQICWQFENLWTAARWTFKGTIFFFWLVDLLEFFITTTRDILLMLKRVPPLKPLGVFKYFLGKYFKSLVCPFFAVSKCHSAMVEERYCSTQESQGIGLHWVLLNKSLPMLATQGRPRLRWEENVLADASRLGILIGKFHARIGLLGEGFRQ